MTTENAILKVRRLGFSWEPLDPFLFCIYHDDRCTKGNARIGSSEVQWTTADSGMVHSEMFSLRMIGEP